MGSLTIFITIRVLHQHGPPPTRGNSTCSITMLDVHVSGSFMSSRLCSRQSVPCSRQLPTRRLASRLSMGVIELFFYRKYKLVVAWNLNFFSTTKVEIRKAINDHYTKYDI